MKAIRVNKQGGPEILSYEDVEVTEPGEGEARVKLAASGVNFIDTYQRTGLYPRETPFTLGLEGAGEVEAVGEGVENAEQLEHLRRMGCDLVQGHHLAWPLPGEEVDPLLTDRLIF